MIDTPKISCYYKTPPRREQASGGALEKEQTVTTLGKVLRWKLKKVLTIYDTHAIMQKLCPTGHNKENKKVVDKQ